MRGRLEGEGSCVVDSNALLAGMEGTKGRGRETIEGNALIDRRYYHANKILPALVLMLME
jgi:hypothetical protein